MPRSIPKTDFSSIQKAIDDAFQTYWRVREGREQRGENEKQRQALMQQTMMTERGATERTKIGETGAMARTQYGEKAAGERLGMQLGSGAEEAEKQRTWQAFQNELDRANKLALQNKELAEKKKLEVATDLPRIVDSASEMIRGVMAAIKAGEETLFLSYPNFTPADWRTFATLKDPNLLQAVKKKVIAYYKEITSEAAKLSGVDIGKSLEGSLPVQTVPIDLEKATKGLNTGAQSPMGGIMPPAQPGVPPRFGPPPVGLPPPSIDWSGKSDVELFNKIKNYIKQQFGK